mmetsp:Transcript_118588/g.177253  ORF Transcript_118588/g.177253 Transcript_118588/m.177253 type:complete len:83 (+) Transcript_118588:163-411(+)
MANRVGLPRTGDLAAQRALAANEMGVVVHALVGAACNPCESIQIQLALERFPLFGVQEEGRQDVLTKLIRLVNFQCLAIVLP